MPGPLVFFRSDPNFAGGVFKARNKKSVKIRRLYDSSSQRGSGWYWHRGNGVFSKYSSGRDAVIRSRGTNAVGDGWRKGRHVERDNRYIHTHDYPSLKESRNYPTFYEKYGHVRSKRVSDRNRRVRSL